MDLWHLVPSKCHVSGQLFVVKKKWSCFIISMFSALKSDWKLNLLFFTKDHESSVRKKEQAHMCLTAPLCLCLWIVWIFEITKLYLGNWNYWFMWVQNWQARLAPSFSSTYTYKHTWKTINFISTPSLKFAFEIVLYLITNFIYLYKMMKFLHAVWWISTYVQM